MSVEPSETFRRELNKVTDKTIPGEILRTNFNWKLIVTFCAERKLWRV